MLYSRNVWFILWYFLFCDTDLLHEDVWRSGVKVPLILNLSIMPTSGHSSYLVALPWV